MKVLGFGIAKLGETAARTLEDNAAITLINNLSAIRASGERDRGHHYAIAAAPLRPVRLREAFAVLTNRWRPFLKTMIRVTLRIVLGSLLLIIPGIVIWIRYLLYAPVVFIERLEKKAAVHRARELA